ncbi:MAG: TetR/AcrR family transcriptional regulator [Bdellovibrionales bacterium]|nr:TetR/AcrR family transcriptional regulator [Bdellovibrionales bacterium]
MSAAKRPDSASSESGAHSSSGPEATRQALLKAGTELFAKHGFDGASVKEIADRAGVNVSLVSYHFGGKEGLYRAALDQHGQAKLEMATRILKVPANPEEFRLRLRMFIEEILHDFEHQECVMRMIHRDVEMDLPVVQEVFKERFLKIFETLTKFFKVGEDKGWFHDGVDQELAAGMLIGMVQHQMRSDHLNHRFFGRSIKDGKYRQKVIDQILGLFLRGLLRGEEGPRSSRGGSK